MASKDMESTTKEYVAINSQSITTDTTTNGNEIDTAGYESVTFFFSLGDWTDGTYTPLIEETDTSGTYSSANVADADLLPDGTGQEAAAAIGADYAISKLGYRGGKRYVRASFVSASTSSGTAGASAICILQNPTHAPVA